MMLRTKTALAAGFVLAVGVAATAFGQTGGSAPAGDPNAERPAAVQESARPDRPERPVCGRPGTRRGQDQRRRVARRLVHSETKVQTREGFATIIADRGTIASVDVDAKTVTIKRADDQTVTVTASDETRICKDGKPATLSDLKSGDLAGIVQGEKDGTRVVRRIAAHSPDTAASSGASADDLIDADLLA